MDIKNERIKLLLDDTPPNAAVFISSKPNIFYYSGFKSEDARLLITHHDRFIITDSRYFLQAKEQAKGFEILDISKGYKKIFESVADYDIAIEEDNLTYGETEKIKASISSEQTIIKYQTKINSPRKIKDEEEVRFIREAEKIGDEAFLYILDKIRVGVSEKQIALELELFMRKCGAEGLSFETIVASGKRSAMPHGVASEKLIEDGDFLAMDFGCVFEGYCSDMTRTVVVGYMGQWQKDIYNLVLKAQLSAIDSIKAGVRCSEVDKVARDIISEAGFGDGFSHGLGHSLGLEIHEMPSLSPRCNEVVRDGYILTVEPGIYLPDMGGVRIEDLVTISDGKAINLTNSPKEIIRL